MSKKLNVRRKKHVKIFIITLIILQGIYVLIPLPDIWPIGNYSMFSKSHVETVASKLEIRGVTGDGEEVALDISKHFYPMDRIRLSRGISRILDSEKYRAKNQRRINKAVDFLEFLPVDKEKLRVKISNSLVYENNFESKEEALRDVFNYLFEQYKYNNNKSVEEYKYIDELNLYRIYWDWTDTAPGEVISEQELLFSTKTGLVQDE